MAHNDIEMRELDSGSQNDTFEPILEDQRHATETKHTLWVRPVATFKRRIQSRAFVKVEKRPDELEKLLESADDASTAGASASLRNDYMHFKDRPGTELINSLVLFRTFIPPVVGRYV